MTLASKTGWEIAAAAVALAALTGTAIWYFRRRRPTPEEIEAARREFLVQSGRLVDGMLLDVCDMPATDGHTLKMLIFSYRIGGVDYECSQDITTITALINLDGLRVGFPCSVRYQPGNPQSSIVVAEGWSGLREGLPQIPAFADPNPLDLSHLRQKAK
jgi:hypothetical protein